MSKEEKREKKTTIVFGRSKIWVIIIILIIIAAGFAGFVISNTTKTEIKSRMVEFNLKNIGELVTQAGYFTNVQSISSSRQLFGITVPFTESSYVYSYDGIVKAGINFEKVELTVDEEEHVISVTMPETEILSIEVDENSLELYDETKNIFTPLSISTFNDSISAMKEEVRQKAIDNGLLENARTNAETLIKGFLSGAYDLSLYTFEFTTLEGDIEDTTLEEET